MATVRRFEDLECWKTARILCKRVYELTLKENFSRDYKFVNQIRDSSGSGMDNIAEGFDRQGVYSFPVYCKGIHWRNKIPVIQSIGL